MSGTYRHPSSSIQTGGQSLRPDQINRRLLEVHQVDLPDSRIPAAGTAAVGRYGRQQGAVRTDAELFVERLIEDTDKLEDHPRSGWRVPEADQRDDIRELIVQGYRIIYRIEADEINILTFIHGSRDLAGRKGRCGIKRWDAPDYLKHNSRLDPVPFLPLNLPALNLSSD